MKWVATKLCVIAGLGLVMNGVGVAQFQTIGPGGGGTPSAMGVNPNVDQGTSEEIYVTLDVRGFHFGEMVNGDWNYRNRNTGKMGGAQSSKSIRAMHVLPDGQNVKILLGCGDGIYESTDKGGFWEGKAGTVNHQIGAFVSHTEGGKTRIWAGTGEGYATWKEDGTGPGYGEIYRWTSDSGTWEQLTVDGMDPQANISCLAVKPNGDVLWAATDRGLYKSVNRPGDGLGLGAHWEAINDKLGLGTSRVNEVVHAESGVFISVTQGDTGTAYSGVYRINEAGTSKTRVLGPENGGGDHDSVGMKLPSALAVDPFDSDVIYAGFRDFRGGLWRSTNASGNCTWSLLFDGRAQCWGWHPSQAHCAVGADIVLVKRDDSPHDNRADRILFSGDNSGQLFRSADQGNNWEQVYTTGNATDGYAGKGEIEFLFPNKMLFLPGNKMWFTAMDWKAFYTGDVSTWAPLPAFKLAQVATIDTIGPEGSSCASVAVDSNGAVYLAHGRFPTDDFGGVTRRPPGSTGNGSGSWDWIGGANQANGLPTGSVMALTVQDNYLYATVHDSGVYRYNTTNGWSEVTGVSPEGHLTDEAKQYLRTLAQTTDPGNDPDDPQDDTKVLLVGTGGGVGINGGLWRNTLTTDDDPIGWTQVLGPSSNDSITEIVVDPVSANVIYCTVSGTGNLTDGVYRSTDTGASWNLLAETPSPTSLAVFREHPWIPPAIYVGTDTQGVYQVYGSGDDWSSRVFHQSTDTDLAEDQLQSNKIRDVELHDDPNKGLVLYVATSGKGIQRIPVQYP